MVTSVLLSLEGNAVALRVSDFLPEMVGFTAFTRRGGNAGGLFLRSSGAAQSAPQGQRCTATDFGQV